MTIVAARISLVILLSWLICACDQEGERAAKDDVRQMMKDPGSAEFRSVERCKGDQQIWRGEVNAKNSFGAMAGFSPFYARAGHASLPESYDFSEMMHRCYD